MASITSTLVPDCSSFNAEVLQRQSRSSFVSPFSVTFSSSRKWHSVSGEGKNRAACQFSNVLRTGGKLCRSTFARAARESTGQKSVNQPRGKRNGRRSQKPQVEVIDEDDLDDLPSDDALAALFKQLAHDLGEEEIDMDEEVSEEDMLELERELNAVMAKEEEKRKEKRRKGIVVDEEVEDEDLESEGEMSGDEEEEMEELEMSMEEILAEDEDDDEEEEWEEEEWEEADDEEDEEKESGKRSGNVTASRSAGVKGKEDKDEEWDEEKGEGEQKGREMRAGREDKEVTEEGDDDSFEDDVEVDENEERVLEERFLTLLARESRELYGDDDDESEDDEDPILVKFSGGDVEKVEVDVSLGDEFDARDLQSAVSALQRVLYVVDVARSVSEGSDTRRTVRGKADDNTFVDGSVEESDEEIERPAVGQRRGGRGKASLLGELGTSGSGEGGKNGENDKEPGGRFLLFAKKLRNNTRLRFRDERRSVRVALAAIRSFSDEFLDDSPVEVNVDDLKLAAETLRALGTFPEVDDTNDKSAKETFEVLGLSAEAIEIAADLVDDLLDQGPQAAEPGKGDEDEVEGVAGQPSLEGSRERKPGSPEEGVVMERVVKESGLVHMTAELREAGKDARVACNVLQKLSLAMSVGKGFVAQKATSPATSAPPAKSLASSSSSSLDSARQSTLGDTLEVSREEGKGLAAWNEAQPSNGVLPLGASAPPPSLCRYLHERLNWTVADRAAVRTALQIAREFRIRQTLERPLSSSVTSVCRACTVLDRVQVLSREEKLDDSLLTTYFSSSPDSIRQPSNLSALSVLGIDDTDAETTRKVLLALLSAKEVIGGEEGEEEEGSTAAMDPDDDRREEDRQKAAMFWKREIEQAEAKARVQGSETIAGLEERVKITGERGGVGGVGGIGGEVKGSAGAIKEDVRYSMNVPSAGGVIESKESDQGKKVERTRAKDTEGDLREGISKLTVLDDDEDSKEEKFVREEEDEEESEDEEEEEEALPLADIQTTAALFEKLLGKMQVRRQDGGVLLSHVTEALGWKRKAVAVMKKMVALLNQLAVMKQEMRESEAEGGAEIEVEAEDIELATSIVDGILEACDMEKGDEGFILPAEELLEILGVSEEEVETAAVFLRQIMEQDDDWEDDNDEVSGDEDDADVGGVELRSKAEKIDAKVGAMEEGKVKESNDDYVERNDDNGRRAKESIRAEGAVSDRNGRVPTVISEHDSDDEEVPARKSEIIKGNTEVASSAPSESPSSVPRDGTSVTDNSDSPRQMRVSNADLIGKVELLRTAPPPPSLSSLPVTAGKGSVISEDREAKQEEDGGAEEDEEGGRARRRVHLAKWQLKKLVKALRQGKRHVNIRELVGETKLDRNDVLAFLSNPPPGIEDLDLGLDEEEEDSAAALLNPLDEVAADRSTSSRGDADEAQEKEEVETEEELLANLKAEREGVDGERDGERGEGALTGPWNPALQQQWERRKRFRKEHVATFERVFRSTKYPSGSLVAELVDLTKLPRRKVLEWFSERREQQELVDRQKWQRPSTSLDILPPTPTLTSSSYSTPSRSSNSSPPSTFSSAPPPSFSARSDRGGAEGRRGGAEDRRDDRRTGRDDRDYEDRRTSFSEERSGASSRRNSDRRQGGGRGRRSENNRMSRGRG
eukprot:TRINITY_DN22147_c0_g2_i1.p1 TRINITY_DN22147_c0_g2~~TRINITY_DN22147_c0_g2_i1.p1  ORF type:complete len:1650 (+),score=480.21 TRINITY_DN22147_c0_g2_i1:252-5201(+)